MVKHTKFTHIDIIVFLVGTIGLALQILAGRLLTPDFGSSVYTWGSIIGVFMVCLSIGYFLAGKYMEKIPSHIFTVLTSIITVWILGIILFGDVLSEWFSSLAISVQYSVLPAVLVLFGPIIFCVGFLTPVAINASKEMNKGKASSTIFTLDTIGSIVGCFGATFS